MNLRHWWNDNKGVNRTPLLSTTPNTHMDWPLLGEGTVGSKEIAFPQGHSLTRQQE